MQRRARARDTRGQLSVTTQEQTELAVVLRWVKGVGIAALVAAFTFGLWIARLQSQVGKVEPLVQEHTEWQQVMADLVLLQCADTALNPTEQRICRRYEPRMPR